jgi:hypothetical protein
MTQKFFGPQPFSLRHDKVGPGGLGLASSTSRRDGVGVLRTKRKS